MTKEERKAKKQALRNRLAELSESERQALAAKCGTVTIEGRQLSINNLCLVWMQNPGATIVGGFRQWKKAGRIVRKGEHGIAIWVPIGHKNTDTDEMDDITGFILGAVFDISQTVEIGAEESEAA